MRNPFIAGSWVRADNFFGRSGILREVTDGDKRHQGEHENRRQFGQPIPDCGDGRLSPRRPAAKPHERDAAGFAARRRRQVAGGDPSQRRERRAHDADLAALRAQEAAPPCAGDE